MMPTLVEELRRTTPRDSGYAEMANRAADEIERLRADTVGVREALLDFISVADDSRVSSEAIGIRVRNSFPFFSCLLAALSPSHSGREALEKIAKLYVDAPGWANPTPTTELVWGMYSIARDALKATPSPPDRRHPAAADDVDAILAMPRSDAVNEGLLADKIATVQAARVEGLSITHYQCADGTCEKSDGSIREVLIINAAHRDMIVAALRAVPSPDTVGVREALNALSMWCTGERLKIRGGRGGFDKMTEREIGIGIVESEIDRRAAALSPSHCTAGRREEWCVEHNEQGMFLVNAFIGKEPTIRINVTGLPEIEAVKICGVLTRLALSEQSGPTAGRDGHASRPNSIGELKK